MKRSPLIILGITLFLDMLGFGMILPLLPVYIEHYGGKAVVGGLLMASFSMMQFIFAPIWGRLSDRRGRRPLILLSLCGSGVSYFFFGAAPNLWVLFGARVASGILTAASIPTSQAYIADITPPEKRAGGMAVMGAAFGLGFAFGPVVGGQLSKFSLFGLSPLATPAFFAAALAFCNFVWAFFMLPESHHERSQAEPGKSALDVFPDIARAMRHPAVSAQLTVFAFATFAFAAVESTFSWLVILRFQELLTQMAAHTWQSFLHLPLTGLPAEIRKALPAGVDWAAFSQQPFAALPPNLQKLLTEKAATSVTSHLFAIVGITILFTQGAVMGGMARRIGENRLVWLGTFLLTASLIGLALTHSLFVLEILSALIAIGSGVLNPSLNALITHSAGPQDRGMLSGAQQGLGSLARIIAPPINNSLVMAHTAIPFFSSAVLMGIAFLLSLRLRPLPHSPASETASPSSLPAEENPAPTGK
ncbi:MAG TPA: MFS transporter [Chthonomonadaceae bacterium]|nr:MFS transporter [Chthonomonadaceae bacterium]